MMREKSKQFGLTHGKGAYVHCVVYLISQKRKKPNVAVWLIDSIAQQHAHRSLPLSLGLLQSISDSGYFDVFEFKKYHVVGWHSAGNQVALFAGTPQQQVECYFRVCSFYQLDFKTTISPLREQNAPISEYPEIDRHCNDSLWGFFGQEDYLTLNIDAECKEPRGPMHFMDNGFIELACRTDIMVRLR
jgi:hypothetical protein